MGAPLRLGEVLLESGYITRERLERALSLQKESGGKKRLGDILIENNILSEDRILSALSRQLNLKYISLSDVPVDLKAVARVPKATALKYCLIAANMENSVLILCINDPLNYYALEEVKLITRMQIETRICKRDDILKAIDEFYSEIEAQKAARGANETAAKTGARPLTDLKIDISETSGDTPVVSLINSTLYKARGAGASDIHIEPFENNINIRIRIDGQIVDYLTIAKSLHNSMVSRIKILSGLDIAEKRIPQDGRFSAKLEDAEINVRVSVMPTVYGEKIVLRFMDRNTVLDNADTFGMDREDFEKMTDILKAPHGLIYITGPTGSGKTTTLYMIMEALSHRLVNIAAIEDPVEKNLPKINQTQINPPAGLTFESGLRSILRQDPDIIMIGETRDPETAAVSVRSALTGHLVLSSLHTNDSVSAIVRLIDMGVEEYLLANSLIGVAAQRLVKKICRNCYEEYTPSGSEPGLILKDAPSLARGAGCHNCNNTGFKGRAAVHEILYIDSNIRSMISKKSPAEDIYGYIKANKKMKSLRESLLNLVLEKKTSVGELLKLTYFTD
ncbi:MAG: Flp pilus assembly complex ATPase component TadA [Oscillospiraceae bacterium]|nr:Flp pilus assembly complex ATPase component TadA [Oscillospiraceae bacterium]